MNDTTVTKLHNDMIQAAIGYGDELPAGVYMLIKRPGDRPSVSSHSGPWPSAIVSCITVLAAQTDATEQPPFPKQVAVLEEALALAKQAAAVMQPEGVVPT